MARRKQVCKTTWEKLWSAITGEWMLELGHPNGGTIIFLRSLQVSATIYAIALALHTGIYAEWTLKFWKWPCLIDFGQLKMDITGHLPALGGIFAGVYTALYARFASQWSYLAGVYNQMREALVRTAEPNGDHLVMWRAAFIENALDLHLATKKMFRPFLLRMLDMPPVAAKFDDYTVDGEEQRKKLEKRLRKRGGHLPRRAVAKAMKELPVRGLTESKQKDLRDLCTALCDKYVFQDLTEDDARRLTLVIAQASVVQGKTCADAAPVVMAWANDAVQTGTDGFWDNQETAGRALHSAARVLGELRPRR